MEQNNNFVPVSFGKNGASGLTNDNTKPKNALFRENRDEICVPYEGTKRILKEIGPMPPKRATPPPFPVTQEFQVGQNEKPITSIKVNDTGFKFYTGGENSTICYFDLSSMKANGVRCQIRIELDENYSISDIDTNVDQTLIAAASGSPIIRIFDPKGLKKYESRRGDMYIYDTTHTYGHTAAVTGLQFRPGSTDELATCSQDGTLRFWKVDHMEEQVMIYRLGKQGGIRFPGYAMRWTNDGNAVFVSSNDQTLSLYDHSGNSRQASMQIPLPNVCGSIAISPDGNHVCTRELTNKGVQLWDIRNINEPLWNILSDSRGQSICFSPNGENLLVGESVLKTSKKGGSIKIVSTLSGDLKDEVLMLSNVGVNALQWHESTNQIYAGCSDGICRILFDKDLSKKGALRALENGVVFKKDTDDAVIGALIPKFVDPETERVIHGFWFPFAPVEKREKRAKQLPVAPLWGEGFKGRIATHPLQKELEELGAVDKPEDDDIVESLKKHADKDKIGYFTKYRDPNDDQN